MVPFQFVIIKSSPSARPYEHASIGEESRSISIQYLTRQGPSILTCALALLALLQLLEESEVPWNLSTHCRSRKMVVRNVVTKPDKKLSVAILKT